MTRVSFFVLLFVLLAVQPVQAQEAMTTILVKDYINETEPVELVISVYDQPQGGMLLYQVTESVTPEDGIFDDSIEVPSGILSRHPQVFVEFAKASSPSEPLAGERMQFAQPGVSNGTEGADFQLLDSVGTPSAAVSVCFTCGGNYPFAAGAIKARTTQRGHNHQRGQNCEGDLRAMRDPRPQICVVRTTEAKSNKKAKKK